MDSNVTVQVTFNKDSEVGIFQGTVTTLKYYLGMSKGDVSNNNYHLRFCEGVHVSEVRFDFVEKM